MMLTHAHVLTLLWTLLLLTIISPSSSQNNNNQNISSSFLCETDNDEIGKRLGCSCSTEKGVTSALCSDRGIIEDLLPPRLNVSIHVRNLDLSRNKLDRLDEDTFGACEGIYELNLHRNEITYVRKLSCSRIRKLDLSWNRIGNLTKESFQNLSQLVDLDLSRNNIVIVEPESFNELQNLRTLNLASNPLGMELAMFSDYILTLEGHEHLENLDLSNTSLPDFPLSLINGTKNIRSLKLANNLISSLPIGVLHNLHNLEYLDLSGNYFEVLAPHGFVGLRRLTSLQLNRMPYLEKIEEHAFAGLESLSELWCQKNPKLSFIDVMAFRVDEEMKSKVNDTHPKLVHLSDNNLNYIEYGLLVWKSLEWLELYRNPWICDCNLQWVSEFYNAKKSDAAVLADDDFVCNEPHIFRTVPVVDVKAEEMLCYSSAATVGILVGVLILLFLMFTFCSIIILNHMGMLPDWVRTYNIFGSGTSLPKYMRVNPKPARERGSKSAFVVDAEPGPPYPGDLEWDNTGGDITNYGPT